MIYMYSTLLSPLLPVISPANVSERKCQEYHSHDGKMFFFFSGWTRLGLSPRDTQEWTIWWGNWWEAMGVQWCVLLSDKPHLKISQALSSYNPMYRKFCRKLAFPQPLSIHRKSPKKNTTRQALGNIAGDSPNFRDLVLQSGGKHEMIPWKNLVIFEWLNGDLMVTSCDYTVIIWWYNFDGDFIWWFTQALVEVQWN